jgi:hypothetical protein
MAAAILDTKPLTSGTLPPSECARPGLHEFLEAIYPYYDICIWSQTSWVWLETKLVELQMVGSDKNYKVSIAGHYGSLSDNNRVFRYRLVINVQTAPNQRLTRSPSPRQDFHVHRLFTTGGQRIHAFRKTTPNYLESSPAIACPSLGLIGY